MEKVRCGEATLAYERAGATGEPVVLLHGGWDDHRTWDRVVGGLSAALQVLVVDRRGHGESRGPPPPRPTEGDVGDLAAVLEAADFFPVHLVAHASAGGLAFRFAAERPEMVRSVAVHEPTFPAFAREPGPLLERLAELQRTATREPRRAAEEYLALFGAPEEQWSRLGREEQAARAGAAEAWAREVADPEATAPTEGTLAETAIPVLVSVGGRSPPYAGEIADRLLTHLPNAASVRLADGGHYAHREAPDLYVGVLGAFLLERNVPST